MRLPPTVVFSESQASSSGQQLSLGRHLQVEAESDATKDADNTVAYSPKVEASDALILACGAAD